jgi:hypothetical protein
MYKLASFGVTGFFRFCLGGFRSRPGHAYGRGAVSNYDAMDKMPLPVLAPLASHDDNPTLMGYDEIDSTFVKHCQAIQPLGLISILSYGYHQILVDSKHGHEASEERRC